MEIDKSNELKNWDLWGPLILCMTLAVYLKLIILIILIILIEYLYNSYIILLEYYHLVTNHMQQYLCLCLQLFGEAVSLLL